jgi:hypothetical protein
MGHLKILQRLKMCHDGSSQGKEGFNDEECSSVDIRETELAIWCHVCSENSLFLPRRFGDTMFRGTSCEG